MAKYLGNRPTAVPLTSADIQDGVITAAVLGANSVDSSELVDNSVTLAKMAGLARGKLIYGDTSGDPAALAVGSANEVLTHDGTDFDWAAAAAGGKVLQVVSDTFTQGNWQTCSSSYVTASGFDLSITPAATTSKILLLANAYVHSQYNTDTVDWAFYRDSTQIKLGNHNLKGSYDQYHNLSWIYIDSPSSTSSIDYTLKLHPNGTGCVQLRSNGQNSFVLMEIGA